MVTAPAIWGNIPQRNKNFTGRAGIFDLLSPDKLSSEGPGSRKLGNELRTRALQGLGGVGKSALAVEYAHRYRGDYDLVWWIPSDHPALVRSSLAALATRLGLPAAMSSGIETAAAAALDALRRGDPYSRWLLVFENADQPEELNQIIPRGPGDVLITTRNHRWQAVVDTVSVDVFERAESIEFLRRRAPRTIHSDDEAGRVADKLGDLPLALEQAGALMSETGLSPQEYITLLDENVTQLMAEGRAPEYPMSMTAAWQLSVDRLEQFLPQARELLRCCAFFGPDPIPRDVFRRGAQAPGTGRPLAGLLANPIMLASAIRELGRFALVTIDGRTIVVHRLIQALIRDELDAEEQASYRHDVHAILAAGAPPDPSDGRQWTAFAELVAHVGADVTDLAGCRVPTHRAVALHVLRYLYLSGDLASCQSFAERFIKGWADERDPAVLDAKRHLGNVLRQLGRYPEAYSISSAALRLAEDSLGPRDRLTLALRNAFGADLRAVGDFPAARQLDERTRELHAEVFGPTDPQTLRVASNLALDYVLNSGYPAARDLNQWVFQRQNESASGVSASEILSSWNSLAWDVRLCGDYSGARDASVEAWDYGREQLGPEHYQTLRTTNGLAIALRQLGGLTGFGTSAAESLLAEALRLARQVLGQCTRLYGDGHPDTLAAAVNLTSILRATGDLAEALSLAQATVTRYPAAYGEDHPYHYGSTGNLAVLWRLSADATQARRLDELALAGLDRRLGRDHHYSLTVAANLASDLAATGDTDGAVALSEDTVRRSRALLGAGHPFTLGCASNLVLDLRAAGPGSSQPSSSQQSADQLANDTLTRFTAVLGASHSDVQQAVAGRRLSFDFDPPAI
jgi:tetratricopeptide (TPR) repeat protein